ncbi:MAG TPA: CooT family nickel-binding protein [Desulfatiglandales bacterium]|nr:CooT family nickel-binding protein [Desulfatiglandales bacterium]
MCEASAYLFHDGKEELILEHVDELHRQGDTIKIINLFGEQRVLDAQIKMISFANSKILLQKSDD